MMERQACIGEPTCWVSNHYPREQGCCLNDVIRLPPATPGALDSQREGANSKDVDVEILPLKLFHI